MKRKNRSFPLSLKTSSIPLSLHWKWMYKKILGCGIEDLGIWTFKASSFYINMIWCMNCKKYKEWMKFVKRVLLKQHRDSFPQGKAWIAKAPLELIHSDVCRPMKTSTKDVYMSEIRRWKHESFYARFLATEDQNKNLKPLSLLTTNHVKLGKPTCIYRTIESCLV